MDKFRKLFSSECVSAGHPDNVCAVIAAKILDECVKQDPSSRCGIEVLVTSNAVVLGGEIRTKAVVDYEALTRKAIKEIGYTDESYNFDCCSVKITNLIKGQSDDIFNGVDKEKAEDLGYGDQGIMFGYACNETDKQFPITMLLAQTLCANYMEFQKKHEGVFSPDMKSQVTLDVDENVFDTIVIAASHKEGYSVADLRDLLVEGVVLPTIKQLGMESMYDEHTTDILVNTSGKFVICGPHSDAGVTGRKLICDTYGGHGRIGGGFMGGKDASKGDRSLALALRHVAKNLVAAGVADRLEIQAATAIGEKDPVSIFVDTFGTNKTDKTDTELAELIYGLYDFTPYGIIKHLDLLNTKTEACAAHGYFGRDFEQFEDGTHCFSWEKLDLVPQIKEKLGL